MDVHEQDIAKSVRAFAVVGLFQGLLLAAADYYFGLLFHPDLKTAMVVLILILTNGGFHLDGLSDTFDAMAVKSSGDISKDREKRLSLMKGSTAGPIGVIAIIFAILLKYLALKNLSNATYFVYYASLIMMPIISKWAMAVSMFHGRSARGAGLGNIFIGKIKLVDIAVITASLIILIAGLLMAFNRYAPETSHIFFALLTALIYIFCLFWNRFFNKKIGGITGDTLGALSEVSEIMFLLLMIIWLRLYI
jgi:adenosylcobinamide-GDP ribazoletransferase